jgi:hypothetical protein
MIERLQREVGMVFGTRGLEHIHGELISHERAIVVH